MSTRTLALQNYISQDGFVFPEGPMVHRVALKHLHASWATHLKQFNNVDAKIVQLFQAMRDNDKKYVYDTEGFWNTVKEQLPWALFLSISDISDIAESVVQARRNYVDKFEDMGRIVKPSKKTLPKLVTSWIQWHDKLRRASRSSSIALSFVPLTLGPSPAMSASAIYSLSSSGRSGTGRKCLDAMPEGAPKAGSVMPSWFNSDSKQDNGPAYSSVGTGSNSHAAMMETGPPLPSSLRVAKIITMSHDEILQSTESLTDPRTHQYHQSTDPLRQPMYRASAQNARASVYHPPRHAYRGRSSSRSSGFSNMSQASSSFRVQKAVANTHTTSAIAYNAAKILAADDVGLEAADIPIPSIEADELEMSSPISEEDEDEVPTADSPSQEMLQNSTFSPTRSANSD